LQLADRNVLVFEAADIRSRLTLPILDEDPLRREHLGIYFKIAEAREALQELGDRAVAVGYRNSMVIPMPTSEVGQELSEIKRQLQDITRLLAAVSEEVANPNLNGVSLQLGFVSADLKAMRAVSLALSNYLSKVRVRIDAGYIWFSSQELHRLAALLADHITQSAIRLSINAVELVQDLCKVTANVAIRGQAVLTKGLTKNSSPERNTSSSRDAMPAGVLGRMVVWLRENL
jgi:hypothetical protein